jgi:uncharacterized protein (TIGR02246 family)
MNKTIRLIASIALLSIPPITSIPGNISPGSASPSAGFQEKSGETSPQNQATSNEEKQIKTLVKQFVQAESENDADTLARITSDDWVIMNPKGPGPSKREVITNIRKDAPALPHYSAKSEGESVYVFGNTAVATYTKVYLSSRGQEDRENHTDVLTKQDGNWKICFSQAASSQQKKP